MRIIISGTVGVGKSTISNLLEKEIKKINKSVHLYDEIQDDNPYLSFYYENIDDWSFLIQLDFLFERFKTYYSDLEEREHNISIFDRSFVDDYIFANLKSIRNTLTKNNENIYMSLNKEMVNKIEIKPDYFFLLKADFDEVLGRVKNRGRDFEQNNELIQYWKDLYFQYYENELIQNYINQNVKKLIIIDASKTQKEIVDEILKILKIK